MKLKPIASNQTEVETDRYKILFSYNTPVAYLDKSTGKKYKTNEHWSRTTTRHINMNGFAEAATVPQAQISAVAGQ